MYGQMGAVTGLRKRPSYTDIINAETPYLPGKVQAGKDRAHQEEMDAFNKEIAEKEWQLADESAHEQRKQQNRANNLGYANLATNIAGQTGALGDLYDWISGMF